jgi:DNA polymerase
MRPELLSLSRELLARCETSRETEWSSSHEEASPLEALSREVDSCRRCRLGGERLRAVFGVGSSRARVMFVGEGPGYEEDRRGEPFVGKAGELLDRILAAIGLSRRTVYIANVVKCHPMAVPSEPDRRGNDRPPTPEETAACRPHLDAQIDLIRPDFLVALGASAARALTGGAQGITALRGQWKEYRGIPLLPTYHPAALLRDESLKALVWKDMKSLKAAMEART